MSKPQDWREWMKKLVQCMDTTLVYYAIAENLEIIHKQFEFFDQDIVVASHPKSGTTWMQQIVSLVMNNGCPEKVRGKRLYLQVPWLEGKEDPESETGYKLLGVRSSPRLMKTHVYGKLVPPGMLQKAKIIYIVRNPKDVAVSYFHMHRAHQLLPSVSWEEFFLELFLPGKLQYGPWHQHVLYWWQISKSHPNVLFIHYEDMIRNLKQAVEKLAIFLNKQLNADAREKIVLESSFARMKVNKDVNYSQVEAMGHETSPFIRRGQVGDWMNYFTKAQNLLFNKKFEEWMAQSDLKIDFKI